MDVGLTRFTTLDNAESIEYPQFLRQSEVKIRTLQRRLAHKKKGSRRWKQICFSLARLHQHVKRQREDFQNKLIAALYTQNEVLMLEKLCVMGLLQNHNLAKSISDASFGKFARKALFKAEMFGKHFVAVDPWGTTQFCYNCLYWVPKNLSERKHRCPNCNEELPRDVNSAKLIKRIGLLATNDPSPDGGSSPAELKPLPSLRAMVSGSKEAGSPRL